LGVNLVTKWKEGGTEKVGVLVKEELDGSKRYQARIEHERDQHAKVITVKRV